MGGIAAAAAVYCVLLYPGKEHDLFVQGWTELVFWSSVKCRNG